MSETLESRELEHEVDHNHPIHDTRERYRPLKPVDGIQNLKGVKTRKSCPSLPGSIKKKQGIEEAVEDRVKELSRRYDDGEELFPTDEPPFLETLIGLDPDDFDAG